MKYKSIKSRFKPYKIVSRKSTITGAFVASIASFDVYDEEKIRKAILKLGQDPDKDLLCVYCDSKAQTWDHVHAIVKNREFSGYGHHVGNLLPSCSECNSKKRSMHWRDFLLKYKSKDNRYKERARRIIAYTKQHKASNIKFKHIPEYKALQKKLEKVLKLLNEADKLAATVRDKSRPRVKKP